MNKNITVVATQNLSDAACTLVKLASEVTASAKLVSVWANSPAAGDLGKISADISERTQALLNAISAHLEADRPSLANMKWRYQIAEDRVLRAAEAFDSGCQEWHTPEWEAARKAHQDAYQLYLQARRELRAHPEWKPKYPKKARMRSD